MPKGCQAIDWVDSYRPPRSSANRLRKRFLLEYLCKTIDQSFGQSTILIVMIRVCEVDWLASEPGIIGLWAKGELMKEVGAMRKTRHSLQALPRGQSRPPALRRSLGRSY